MAKRGGNVAARVEALVRPVLEEMGLRLWDVRYEKEGTEWYLRIWIDRDEPMDTDTCEAASRAIDPLLDEEDPVDHSYILEVGSPGLGRKLTKEKHFEAKQGCKVRVKFYRADADGRKELVGELVGKTQDTLLLRTEEGREEIPVKEISLVKLCDDEDLF
ncbi:ribosome maturation factor RimP [Ruminococcaceae bacterium OttesenSCG-928-I18]|nr:ribosome maturation factor RimP [Ruminococcaceae bacterium OttesenSCG-928-I18]